MKERGTGRLPSVRQAASALQASPRTVLKALHSLEAEGHVQARPGAGFFAMGHKALAPSTPLHWEDIATHLQLDLAAGLYPSGQRLPPLKECARRYGASQPTLRKALQYLEAQGYIRREGQAYILPGAAPRRARVVLVAAAEGKRLRMDTHREREFFRCVEEECHSLNLELQLLGYDPLQRRLLGHPPDKGMLGVLFAHWHILDAAPCLRELLKWKHPLSIWLESPDTAPWARTLAREPLCSCFSSGQGRAPGRDLGLYLHALGHREICFISPFHASAWSIGRLEGLSSVLTQVHACTDNSYANDWSLRDAVEEGPLAELPPSSYVPVALQEGASEDLMRRCKEWVLDEARDQALREALMPLLLEAGSHKDATAWVFANDYCALQARLLPVRGPALSLSFDNSPEAYMQGLDSYEFGTRGMVRAMLHHLLAPTHPLYRGNHIQYAQGRLVRHSLLRMDAPPNGILKP